MCRSRVLSAIVLSVLFCHPTVSYADAGLLRTIQPLDETRGYCVDIRGEGQTLRLDEPLQVHTCKYGAPLDDQRFERTPTEPSALLSTTGISRPPGCKPARNCWCDRVHQRRYPTMGELTYFGGDKTRWPQMVVPGNITRVDIPVLMTTAEWDEPRYYPPLRSCSASSSSTWREAAISAKPRAQSRVSAALARDRGHQRVARDPRLHRSRHSPRQLR